MDLSGIEWTDSTFNPWIGCTKISPACDNCYAADWAKRYGDVKWGAKEPRRRTGEKNWNNPRRWNRKADEWFAAHGRKRFVFCASLADVFDNAVPAEWRDDLWRLIKECDQLVWLLLTKRPQNIAKMLPDDWGDGYPNVWLGATVENQEIADRNIPHLLDAPAAKRFLSIEPIVGPIDLTRILAPQGQEDHGRWEFNCLVEDDTYRFEPDDLKTYNRDVSDGPWHGAIDWVITGGESGPNARPAHPDWYRQLRDECVYAGVPFHFKQWGEWIPWEFEHMPTMVSQHGGCVDRHELPADMDADPKWTDACLYDGDDVCCHQRVGKKAAGRLLDGRTWDDRPTSTEGDG